MNARRNKNKRKISCRNGSFIKYQIHADVNSFSENRRANISLCRVCFQITRGILNDFLRRLNSEASIFSNGIDQVNTN